MVTMPVNWSNITDFAQIPQAANTASGGSFWVGMLYMIWIILILLMIGWGFEAAMLVASFLSLIIGLLLVYADLVAWGWVATFAGVIVVMILYITWNSGREK
jgi:hypothetical protein